MFPQIDKKQMGQRLKHIMKEKNVTPKEIQQYLCLSCVQTIYRWIEGVNVPCIDHLYALSILLGVTMEELVAGETKKPYPLKRWKHLHRWDWFIMEQGEKEGTDAHGDWEPREPDVRILRADICMDVPVVRMGTYYGKMERLRAA